jgi:hypothetical protein
VADPGVPLNESQRVAAYRLNELLTRQLPRKLALAARDVSQGGVRQSIRGRMWVGGCLGGGSRADRLVHLQ